MYIKMETKNSEIDWKKLETVLDTLASIKGVSIAFKNNLTDKWDSAKADIGKNLIVSLKLDNLALKFYNGKWEYSEGLGKNHVVSDPRIFFQSAKSTSAYINYEIIGINYYRYGQMGKRSSFFDLDPYKRLSRENVEKRGGFKLFFDPPTVTSALAKLGISPPVYQYGDDALYFQSIVDLSKKQDERVDITPTP